jgi:opacity protein-like surface antigen
MRIRSGFMALVVLGAAVPAAQAAEGFGGLYGGFTLGSHTRKGDWYTTETRLRDDTRINPGANPADTDEYPDGTVVPFATGTTASLSDTTFAVGLLVGYNWQVNNFVVGLEAALGAAPTYDGGDSPFPGLGTTAYDPITTYALRTSKPITFGLTAGYEIVPGTLAYVRANLERLVVTAQGSSTVCPSANLIFNPTSAPPDDVPEICDVNEAVQGFAAKEKLYGWGAGFGVEQKFGDTLGVRLEYRIAEYGKTKNLTVMDESPDYFGADALVDIRRVGMVELGVIFHF